MFCPNAIQWGDVGSWVAGLGGFAAVLVALYIASRQRADAAAIRAKARKNYATMVLAAVQRVSNAAGVFIEAEDRILAASSTDPVKFQAKSVLREIDLLRLFRPYRDLDNSVLAMSILKVERACSDFVAEFDLMCETEAKIQEQAARAGVRPSARVLPNGVLDKAGPLQDACDEATSKLFAAG